MKPNDQCATKNLTWQLFLISALGLYLEMLLIRWIATEIRIFAYLQNVVLVVCFLGLGMGCFTCRQEIRLRNTLIPLLVLVLLLAVPVSRYALGNISLFLSTMQDFVIWAPLRTANVLAQVLLLVLGMTLTFLLMVLIWDMFVPIGRMLGRLIEDHPKTILAYSVNVAGSLVGTGLFVLLAVLEQPPVVWMLVLTALALPFLAAEKRKRAVDMAMLIAIIALAVFAGHVRSAKEVHWSPYQKLALFDREENSRIAVGDYFISVNNTGYQVMIDLSDQGFLRNSQIDPAMRGLSQYDVPLLLHSSPDRVLVVGAGSGNDVAGALRHGAKHVTAVDIDPAILRMGYDYHPEKPYKSPHVKLVVDDARSFFATCRDKFDLIIFGLLDSHTTTGATTNTRLDHFVYTQKSLAAVRELLAEGGVLVLSFETVDDHVNHRMARVLNEVFGAEPMMFSIPASQLGWGGVLFVAGDGESINECLSNQPRLARQIQDWQREKPIELSYATTVATDDWPYIYLDKPRIPVLFWMVGGLMLLLFFRGRRQLARQQRLQPWGRDHWHFFFLGIAFMLLEVQNITKACAVLGSTWWVNAVIVSGVLIMVLLANAITARFPKIPLMPVYVALCVVCILLYFVDLATFAFLPYVTKALLIGSLTTLPMLFSGIIFVRSFVRVSRKDQALGANMFGALVGGMLQWATFLIGIKALLLVVTTLYVLALLTRPEPSDAAGGSNQESPETMPASSA